MNISIKIFQKEKEIFDKTSELVEKYSSNESIKKFGSCRTFVYLNKQKRDSFQLLNCEEF